MSIIASHTNFSFGEVSTSFESGGSSMPGYIAGFARAGATHERRILFIATITAALLPSLTSAMRSSSISRISFCKSDISSGLTWVNLFGRIIPASSPSTLSMNSVRIFCNAESSFQLFITCFVSIFPVEVTPSSCFVCANSSKNARNEVIPACFRRSRPI